MSSYAAGAPWSATDTRPLRLRATDTHRGTRQLEAHRLRGWVALLRLLG